jgi:hypothetical protein
MQVEQDFVPREERAEPIGDVILEIPGSLFGPRLRLRLRSPARSFFA